ncbi:MAG: succinate dehydrogenase/fumarate reductase iron-sulfur subunit [Alphaproteobacteria bacterium]|nr:succinate dehydrogenase/fumarate reductase iron-sulfur subunit [Alphaproteobacteria bacterium]
MPDGRTLEVKVWRGRESGRFQAFTVPRRASQTVLDVVSWIQRHLDTTLSYRFACRVGMCGSCAMTVNGKPRWTCRTHVDKVAEGDTLTVAPLANLPVVKDLATDMAPFFDKWAKAQGRFVPEDDRPREFHIVPPETSERRAVDAGIECIGCGVCYAACDIVRWNRDYLGPAALNRAWTLVNDVRDAGNPTRLAAVAGDAGCHACHSQENCREHCPKQINATASIAGLKRAAAIAALKGQL